MMRYNFWFLIRFNFKMNKFLILLLLSILLFATTEQVRKSASHFVKNDGKHHNHHNGVHQNTEKPKAPVVHHQATSEHVKKPKKVVTKKPVVKTHKGQSPFKNNAKPSTPKTSKESVTKSKNAIKGKGKVLKPMATPTGFSQPKLIKKIKTHATQKSKQFVLKPNNNFNERTQPKLVKKIKKSGKKVTKKTVSKKITSSKIIGHTGATHVEKTKPIVKVAVPKCIKCTCPKSYNIFYSKCPIEKVKKVYKPYTIWYSDHDFIGIRRSDYIRKLFATIQSHQRHLAFLRLEIKRLYTKKLIDELTYAKHDAYTRSKHSKLQKSIKDEKISINECVSEIQKLKAIGTKLGIIFGKMTVCRTINGYKRCGLKRVVNKRTKVVTYRKNKLFRKVIFKKLPGTISNVVHLKIHGVKYTKFVKYGTSWEKKTVSVNPIARNEILKRVTHQIWSKKT